jgi:hypothetical protein
LTTPSSIRGCIIRAYTRYAIYVDNQFNDEHFASFFASDVITSEYFALLVTVWSWFLLLHHIVFTV